MTNNIDYTTLLVGLNYYVGCGYQYTHLPWAVPVEISGITKPEFSRDLLLYDKALVASAEQSFLDMSLNHNLQKGKYVGLTPCFRDERVDEWHSTYFMKIELFDTENVDDVSLAEMIDKCLMFFKGYVACKVIPTTDGYDIVTELGEIELGSYGIREHEGFKWVYGTGCAEPRLTKAAEHEKLLKGI